MQAVWWRLYYEVSQTLTNLFPTFLRRWMMIVSSANFAMIEILCEAGNFYGAKNAAEVGSSRVNVSGSDM